MVFQRSNLKHLSDVLSIAIRPRKFQVTSPATRPGIGAARRFLPSRSQREWLSITERLEESFTRNRLLLVPRNRRCAIEQLVTIVAEL